MKCSAMIRMSSFIIVGHHICSINMAWVGVGDCLPAKQQHNLIRMSKYVQLSTSMRRDMNTNECRNEIPLIPFS
jgi:hypothetical protein